MARYMAPSQTMAYRAVVTRTATTGLTVTSYFGPYASKAAANQVITRAKRYASRAEVTGRVEESRFAWEPVSDAPGTGKLHTDSTADD